MIAEKAADYAHRGQPDYPRRLETAEAEAISRRRERAYVSMAVVVSG